MNDSEWPLPSQSHRVRLLLYLAEGLIIGAGLAFGLLVFSGAVLAAIESGLITLDFSVAEVIFLFLVLFLLVRAIAMISMGRRYRLDDPPEYQDWTETRRWRWVAAIALPIAGLLLGVTVVLWGWRSAMVFYDSESLLLGTLLTGFGLYLYVLHRIGMPLR